MNTVHHSDLANAIRFLSMDAVQQANSGHPGMPMGMADVATVLFRHALKFDASDPSWPDRDRFVLSAGHGSMLQYALLYLTGNADMTIDDIKNFRQMGSKTAGHPEYGHVSGVETTTGPLGQGLANAVGMAIAERHLNARFGDDLVDHHTWVIAGDGCLMEGISHEAISLAAHLKLNKLTVLWDDNNISIDGALDMTEAGDQCARFEAAGWATMAIDGHDPKAIQNALDWAKEQSKPTLIACKTTIGFGSPKLAGTAKTHGAPLGADEIQATRDALGWPHKPFLVPDAILAAWHDIGAQGAIEHKQWRRRHAEHAQANDFDTALAGEIDDRQLQALHTHIEGAITNTPEKATRQHSGDALEALVPHIDGLIGGSADLTGSNNTKTKDMPILSSDNYGGRYIHYGVREHAMAAAMNGMALHGGIIPYSGTFLVFADYARPAIRLAALMGIRVIHVLTHDSIGLGEDGPTHQPVEHLASLRAIPNVHVFRPADAVETAECWEAALQTPTTPSVLALTRQKLPAVRTQVMPENMCAKGAYELSAASKGDADISLFASGSEVGIALDAQKKLEASGHATRVVSVPCMDLFLAQAPHYRDSIIGNAKTNVGIEAAVRQGWDAIIGHDGAFVGMDSFGASAPAGDLFKHFGITANDVVDAALANAAHSQKTLEPVST